MSELSVSKITTGDNTTPLVFTTGNIQGGFIKVETANDQILFSGTARFANAPVGFASNTYVQVVGSAANTWANNRAAVSNTYAESVGDAANTISLERASAANSWANTISLERASAANSWANTKTSTGKAIAMSIVFG